MILLLLSLLTTHANASTFHRLEETCPEGRMAFEKTVYMKIRKDCAECHAPGGRGPTFVLDDSVASYMRVKSFVDFSSLDRSILSIRAGNNHCGKENCNEASGKEMKTLVSDWWDDGEKNCQKFGKYFTTAIAAPADLPTDLTKWKTITWDLGSISDDLGGAKFSVEAQRYSTPSTGSVGAYRFRKPRIQFAFEPVRVKGIRILINGKYDQLANTYESLDQITAPQESDGGGLLAFPVLSTQTMILLQETPMDQFTLSFDDIGVAARPACKALGRFKDAMLPVLKTNDCISCHSKTGNRSDMAAVKEFSMDLDMGTTEASALGGPQLCSAFLQRSFIDRPLRSPVLEMPLRGKLEHPVVVKDAEPFLQAITTWLEGEK